MKLSDEFKVGVLATFTIITLVLGYSFLKGNNPFLQRQTFYVVYPTISGLNPSDPVQLHGLKIGKVKSLKILPDAKVGVVVELEVSNQIQFTKKSVARIVSSDFLGQKAVELELGESNELLNSKDTLMSDIQLSLTEEVKLEVLPVKKKAEELLESLDSLATIMKVILNKGQIEKSMNGIQQASEEFAAMAKNLNHLVSSESASIHQLLANVNSITENLKNNNQNIQKLIVNLGAVTDSLNKAEIPTLVATLNTSLNEMKTSLELLNNGEGTAGLILKERETYDLINKTIQDLDKLFLDIQENPRRYVSISVFGKNPDKKKKK